MINYLKLQFNYLFSQVFIICYLIIIFVIFIGIYFNAGLDLGYSYLDGFISQYQEEYLNQSVLLIEVVVSISGIFIGGILSSKTNDFLIYYTADNYWSKFLFFLSRLILGIMIIILTLAISGIYYILIAKVLTPFRLNIDIFLKVLVWIFYQALSLQMLVFILISILNHFLVIILPIGIFWFKKTIVIFTELENDFQEVVLKFIPSFMIENSKLIRFQSWDNYLIPLVIMVILTITINMIKDCK